MYRRSFADTEAERIKRNFFLLHDDDTVIKMNAAHVRCVVRRLKSSASMNGVEFVDKIFRELYETSVGFKSAAAFLPI